MLEKTQLNVNEAPLGFYAVDKKEAKTSNVCDSCDARQLCKENKNDWCLKNRCMAYGVTSFKDGKVYKREDNCSVFFKKCC